MGWEWWNGALSQRFNLAGILSSVTVVSRDSHLALPHLSVPDLRWIDWSHLYNRGFRGVVFDKDNTLTTPFSLTLSPTLATSLDRCKSTFGHTKLAVFSNSAGLYQYDPDGSKAEALENSIGIHVIRHGEKKPAGTTEDIEKYFGCETSLLVMVGDRHFTDIVYGNRNGFLTILTEPLNPAEEPFIVKQVRKLEACLVNYWYRKGLKPISHHLLPDGAEKCAEDPQLL
ncbi:haloacid dehalogenase (HAD) superfamily protein isoform X1 [Tasmannia lanceolata]|uniref:haloacid dehalogenase (HAD) superfamily protein isoform X1 n=1 Tax=Tasmannia lanceolata TaxID=3420 RepID=UPI004063A152